MAGSAFCLNTSLKNITSNTLYFGFGAYRGFSLAPGADKSFFGDVWNQLVAGPNPCARKIASFQAALLNGLIEITQMPAVALYDSAQSKLKVLQLSGGALGTADPCWGAYSGSA